jgi:hypothetical protein
VSFEEIPMFLINVMWHIHSKKEFGSQHLAVTRRRPLNNNRGMMFAVCVNGCAHNNEIRHTIAKQQFHYNRRTVFSLWPMLRCYKQELLAVAVSE